MTVDIMEMLQHKRWPHSFKSKNGFASIFPAFEYELVDSLHFHLDLDKSLLFVVSDF